MFLLDSSSDVTLENFEKQKGFVKSLLRWFGVSRGKATASLTSYGNRPRNVFDFDINRLPSDYDRLVDRTTQVGGNRRIDRALEDVRRYFAKSPPNKPRVLVVFAGGRQVNETEAKSPEKAGKALRELRVHIYFVTVGSTVKRTELRQALERTGKVFEVSSFENLWRIHIPLSKSIIQG